MPMQVLCSKKEKRIKNAYNAGMPITRDYMKRADKKNCCWRVLRINSQRSLKMLTEIS